MTPRLATARSLRYQRGSRRQGLILVRSRWHPYWKNAIVQYRCNRAGRGSNRAGGRRCYFAIDSRRGRRTRGRNRIRLLQRRTLLNGHGPGCLRKSSSRSYAAKNVAAYRAADLTPAPANPRAPGLEEFRRLRQRGSSAAYDRQLRRILLEP